jgi:microfibrillar-associated protein 1
VRVADHEGAFYRGGDEGDILEGRDFTAPTGEDAIDKSALPKIMQVRRGWGLKKGHTRYTHLADQDTSDKNGLWFQDKDLAQSYKHKMSATGAVDDRALKRRKQ